MDINEGRDQSLQAIHEMIAHNAPLERSLAAICHLIEGQIKQACCSVLLFEEATQSLRFVAGDSVPSAFRDVLQCIPVGPDCAICGSAAYYKTPVASDDIVTDPRCGPYQALARESQLRACLSYPLIAPQARLLGTFAVYYPAPGAPSEIQREPIRKASALAALAIDHRQDRRALSVSEQSYRSLFTHNPDGVFTLDCSGVLIRANRAALAITALTEDRIIGRHYDEFVIAEDMERADASFRRASQGEPQRYEVSIVDANGQLRVLDVTNLPITIDDEIVGVYGIAKDVTQTRENDTQLRVLRRSVDTSVNGVVITDAKQPDMPISYANEAFLRMTGYALDEVLGLNCRFLSGPDTDPDMRSYFRERIAQRRNSRVTLLNYRKDGTPFWNDMFVSPVPDENGEITHFVGILHDVTLQKANEASLLHQASHESLTGLPNRSLLEKRLNEAYERARQRQALLAVLYVDLDDFKPINDTLGHDVGDQVLKEVAKRLSSVLAPGDTLASVGGDEFVMLLLDREECSRVLALAEQALRLLDKPHRVARHEIHVTGSIGIAINDSDVDQPIELIQHADMAMYLAKRQGRNTYHWYTRDITVSMNERVRLRHDLREAIAGEQFELYYQPMINAASGGVAGVEALIRWRHPTRGLVSPATFIPLAEQTGQIVAIGAWVMRQACEDLVALNQERESDYWVSVNVSPVQFHARDFLSTVIDTLAASGLAAHRLNIELTESVLMENTDGAVDILRTLRTAGIEVFIDDFGTGYSSLSYLKRLPINKVKIDRTFTRDITSDFYDSAIAQGIITMAHNLGLDVVAEGIESEAQRDFLRELRCDLFQGYLFARPMPIDELRVFLDTQEFA